MNPIIPIIILSAASLLAAMSKKEKQIKSLSAAFSIIGGFSVFFVSLPVLVDASKGYSNSLWLIDGFSALMASLVAFVYIAASIVSVRYIGHEYEEKIVTLRDVRVYFSLIHLFALSMLVSVLTNNTLILWLALETTTLSSTFLVGLYRRKTSIEAAWKYMIICSTGITLGLVGILLLSYGLSVSGMGGENIFLLSSLLDNASSMSPDIVRWAFVFLFIGFGAKVGLAPMHAWLPDAHSKAPSPISAMFSGILLNVALYAIIRFKLISDTALGQSVWTGHIFLFFGLISILIPALMMIVQQNYKRMLAYSSVEHMGLITFALSLSPIGAMAAVIHMIGHTLTKSLLFFGAGEILINWKTTQTGKIKGLLKFAPYTAVLFLLGILAIVAFPPSTLFISEYMMFTDAIFIHPVISLVVFVALSVIAYSMLSSTISMFGTSKGGSNRGRKKEKWNVTHTVMTIQLILIVAFAMWVSSGKGLAFIESIAKGAIYVSRK